MNKFILLAIVVLGLITLGNYVLYPTKPKIKIGETTFNLEIAATQEEKTKGLGFRDALPEDTGMLFPYDHKEQYEYWMRGMRFPLDMIWIDGTIIADITPNVPIATGEPLLHYKPSVPVDKVLELNAGAAEKYNLKIGDTVQIIAK